MPPGHPPLKPYSRGRIDGATAELAWRLTSPYLSAFGTAVIADLTAGPHTRSARLRGVLQKNFRDDTLILAANAFVELERREGAPTRAKVTALEVDLGASYRVAANWSLAAEYRLRTEYSGHDLSGRQYTAHFLGPTLHYGGQRWFFTLTALRQLDASVRAPALRADVSDGRLYGARHTRWDGFRVRTGRTF